MCHTYDDGSGAEFLQALSTADGLEARGFTDLGANVETRIISACKQQEVFEVFNYHCYLKYLSQGLLGAIDALFYVRERTSLD